MENYNEWLKAIQKLGVYIKQTDEDDKRIVFRWIWKNCPLLILNEKIEISRETFIDLIRKALKSII